MITIIGTVLIFLLASISIDRISIASTEPAMGLKNSEVIVEGFVALANLTCRLTWGRLVLEEEVKSGSNRATFTIDAINVREALNISLEPDGLLLELVPTPMGYATKTIHIGRNIVVEKALRLKIKETLTVIDLEIYASPSVEVETVSVNGQSTTFLVEDGNTTTIRLPTWLIVDLERPVDVVVEGQGLWINLTVRRGLETNKVVDVIAEASGNFSKVYVRAFPSKVLAVQEVEIPIRGINVTDTVEVYETLMVEISRGEPSSLERQEQGQRQAETTQPEQPLTEVLSILLKHKWVILLAALASLCFAILVGKRAIAALSLVLFIAYFLLAWGSGAL
jgi:hypothetical protein